MISKDRKAYHIEPAKGTDGLVDHCHDLLLFGDIAFNSDSALARRPDSLHQRIKLSAFRGKIADQNVEAVLSKAESNSFSDTLGCASDDSGALRRCHLDVGLRGVLVVR